MDRITESMDVRTGASELRELLSGSLAVGARQLRRAVVNGRALRVYLAQDADPMLTQPLAVLSEEHGVPCTYTTSMRELGRACGIDVSAAAAAVLKEI